MRSDMEILIILITIYLQSNKEMNCNILPIIFALIAVATAQQAPSRFESTQIQAWTELHRIEGTWKQLQVSEPLGKCEPCFYMLQFFKDTTNFSVYSQSKPSSILTFELEENANSAQKIILLTRSFRFKGSSPSAIAINMTTKPHDGFQYSYEIGIPSLGLYIKKQQIAHHYKIPILSIIYSISLAVFIRLNKKFMQKYTEELCTRHCLLTLLFYSQLMVIICSLQFVVLTHYLLHSISVTQKIAEYALFGSCLLMSMISAGYSLVAIQRKLDKLLPENNGCKVLAMLSIFGGVISFPLLICLFSKGVWFMYWMLLGLVVQTKVSYNKKMYPYPNFVFSYAISTLYLALLSNYVPVFNFRELSRLQILALFCVEIIGLIGAYYYLKGGIGVEKLVDLHESGKDYIEKTQADQGSRPSMKTEDSIKSDIELRENGYS